MIARCGKQFHPGAQHGIALVSVLWLLMLLTAVVLTMVRESRLAIQSAAIYAGELQTQAEVQGAIYQSIYQLATGISAVSVIAELQAKGFEIDIMDERAKLNINNASVTELEAYLASHGFTAAETLAMRIVDFRDKDDEAAEGGSERGLYKSKGLAYPPGNRNFLHVNELSRVPGFEGGLSDEILRGLSVLAGGNQSPLLTITIGKVLDKVRQRVRVIVRIDGAGERPFRILRWDWMAG